MKDILYVLKMNKKQKLIVVNDRYSEELENSNCIHRALKLLYGYDPKILDVEMNEDEIKEKLFSFNKEQAGANWLLEEYLDTSVNYSKYLEEMQKLIDEGITTNAIRKIIESEKRTELKEIEKIAIKSGSKFIGYLNEFIDQSIEQYKDNLSKVEDKYNSIHDIIYEIGANNNEINACNRLKDKINCANLSK